MSAKIFDLVRYTIIGSGLFFIYLLFADHPIVQLHYLMPCIVISLSGLTGIEGVFFPDDSAKSLGRATDSPYQKQSAFNNLAVGITGLIVWLANWGLYADAAMLIATLLFISLSAGVHTWEYFTTQPKKLKNLFRGIGALSLLAACLPVLIRALFF